MFFISAHDFLRVLCRYCHRHYDSSQEGNKDVSGVRFVCLRSCFICLVLLDFSFICVFLDGYCSCVAFVFVFFMTTFSILYALLPPAKCLCACRNCSTNIMDYLCPKQPVTHFQFNKKHNLRQLILSVYVCKML